jgi:hypothetical protein
MTKERKVDWNRALTDETYRKTLSRDELALLNQKAAERGELSDADLGAVSGGAKTKKTRFPY